MHLPQGCISLQLLLLTLLTAVVLWKSEGRIGSCGLVRPQRLFRQKSRPGNRGQVCAGAGSRCGGRIRVRASLWAGTQQQEGLAHKEGDYGSLSLFTPARRSTDKFQSN